MAIERHDAGNGEHFHTIQGLLDCGHCNAVLANMPPFQGVDDEGEDILVCQSCGSEFHPEELADARVEEILELVNGKKAQEQIRMLREVLLESLKDNVAHQLISEVIAEEKGYAQLPTEPACIAKARAALDATKET